MPYTEQLIEALSDAERTHSEWWESFDSMEEALAVISNALMETPDEYEVAQVLAFADENGIFTDNMNGGYKQCLRRMKKQLKSASNEQEHGDQEV